MDAAIHHHFGEKIVSRVRLTGGYTFNTWLLTLSDGRKVVFRSQRDFDTGGGRMIVIADILRREKFFYENVNQRFGHICPEVYAVGGADEFYKDAYQITEYLEGTPLNLCIDDLDDRERECVYFMMGEMAARIGQIEIGAEHPYVKDRGPWEEFFAGRLRERLSALLKNGVITADEIEVIINMLLRLKAEKTLSFLHLDMRPVNMIYRSGELFLLDAENCEFGDPLFELAVADMNSFLHGPFMEGYRSVADADFDWNREIYWYYRLERQALVLDVFMNAVKDEAQAQKYLAGFNELKAKLL